MILPFLLSLTASEIVSVRARPTMGVASSQLAQRSTSYLPATYVTPVFGQDRTNVYNQADATVVALTQRSDFPTGWVGSNAYTSIAQWDAQQGTRQFYDFVSAGESVYATNPGGCYDYWQSPLVDCYNDDAQWAGLGSVQQYEAYGDQVFLDRAVSVWNFVYTHGYITQEVLNEGYLEGTKFANQTVHSTCGDQNGNQQSMLAGVYWQNGAPLSSELQDRQAANGSYINSIATGLFANLGAQLCRVTTNTTYCDVAYSSAQWLDRFTVNSDGLLIDGLTGPSCELSAPNSLYSYNSGQYISAYATLGNLTNNATAISLASKTAIAALQTSQWNDQQGVLDEANGDVTQGSDGEQFEAILIRDLHRASPYLSDAQLQADILRYINIQYWSLTQMDSDSKTQPVNYGRNWTGAYEVTTGQSESTAVDVLNALILNPNSAFPDVNATNVPIANIQ